jgi:O-methyltransferase domain/Dimerisation domain
VIPMPEQLENAIYGFAMTTALHLADKHGVMQYLVEHGPSGAAEIADYLDLDRDTLERLLFVLTAFGVLQVAEGSKYQIILASIPFLDTRSDFYIGGFVSHLANESTASLRNLETFLVHGKEQAVNPAAPFDHLYRSAGSLQAFMAAMWDLNWGISNVLVDLADLSDVVRLVDVAGGGGPFAIAALRRWPHLCAVLFDLPAVTEYALEKARAHGLPDRLEIIPGDIFADDFPRGDCLMLGNVLSDWPDVSCRELLDKAYVACSAPGRVVIAERLIDDSRDGPPSAAAMNLVMHLEVSGRHRSAEEYLSMLRAAGFVRCEIRRSSGDRHLIMGHKPAAG